MLYPAVSNFRMANPHGTKFDNNLVNRKSDTEDDLTDEMSNSKEQKEKWISIYTRLLRLRTFSLLVFVEPFLILWFLILATNCMSQMGHKTTRVHVISVLLVVSCSLSVAFGSLNI